MNWYDLSDEERKEWRNNPATLAYFVTIADVRRDAEHGIVSAIMNSGQDAVDDARRLAGKFDGLSEAIHIMESNR